MRAAATSRPGAKTATPTGRKGPAAAAPKVPTAQTVTPDDKEDYILNLKGQVYLLTIENEMMKRTVASGTGAVQPPPTAQRSSAPSMSATFVATPRETTASLLTPSLPPAEYPSEIGDAFEMMRQKYAQLDNKYQQDLDEARRGAEALASQVAAQSSLISTLKREMAASLDTVRGQKLAMQELEARGNSDLEKAMRDIAHLHDRLAELNAVIEAKKDDAARTNVTLADLRSVAANASAEKNAAEATRQRTLESYGRVYMVTRYLLQRWRVERRDKLAVLESFEKMRADRVRALERADAATSANETAQVAACEAFDARDRALEAHRETAASMNLVEQEVERLKGEVDVKSSLLADLDAVIPELQKRVDAAQATAAKAVAQKESAIRRANELERLLADKAGEADDLRSAAIAAEARMRDAMGRVKGLEDDLAGSHARVSALESTEIALEAQAVRLAAEASEASQAAAAGEAELLTLKDELSKRPPIDIIKQLDIENLMQRNVQAASAMQQLLAWRTAHEAHPGPDMHSLRG